MVFIRIVILTIIKILKQKAKLIKDKDKDKDKRVRIL